MFPFCESVSDQAWGEMVVRTEVGRGDSARLAQAD